MDIKKGDPSFTPSFANISTTPDCRLLATVASLLNREMYSLNSSPAPSQINLKSTFIFGLSLLVAKMNLNFYFKSSHKSMDLNGFN